MYEYDYMCYRAYHIAGNFCEAEIFAIFAIKPARENFFRENFFQKFLDNESSTVSSSRRSIKWTEN